MGSPYTINGVSCSNCTSACCRKGINLVLTEKEYEQLSKNTELKKYEGENAPEIKPKLTQRIGAFFTGKELSLPSFYTLESDCGNLIRTENGTACAIYNTPDMPDGCRNFKMGEYACLEIRAYMGVSKPASVPIEIKQKP